MVLKKTFQDLMLRESTKIQGNSLISYSHAAKEHHSLSLVHSARHTMTSFHSGLHHCGGRFKTSTPVSQVKELNRLNGRVS